MAPKKSSSKTNHFPSFTSVEKNDVGLTIQDALLPSSSSSLMDNIGDANIQDANIQDANIRDDDIVVYPSQKYNHNTDDVKNKLASSSDHDEENAAALKTMCSAFSRAIKESTVNIVSTVTPKTFTQGAIFDVIMPEDVPRTVEDFNGRDFTYLNMYMVQPVSPGRASAPYEFARGSKKTKDQLLTINKAGLPLTDWANSNQTEIRFWSCEKKGFNRGNRNESLTWTYGGGDVLKMSIETKDIEPFTNDAGIQSPPTFYLDGKVPDQYDMKAFDIVRVTLMPKTQDSVKNESKKTCFVVKSVGTSPNSKSLASVLFHLTKTMPKSLDEAQARAKKIVSESKLHYAHQLDCMAPKEDRDNFKDATIGTTAFLVSNIGPKSTFVYNDMSKVVRIYIKPRVNTQDGCSDICVDIPVHALMKNANARTIESAIGLYVLVAASGGLHCFTMHNNYWDKTLWDPNSGFNEPTPFRGALIIDASKLFAHVSMSEASLFAGCFRNSGKNSDKKGSKKIMLGTNFFPDMKILVDTCETNDSMDLDENSVELNIEAEVSMYPRIVKSEHVKSEHDNQDDGNLSKFSHDMRLSPYQSIGMDSAYVATFFVTLPVVGGNPETRKNIMNITYNAVYNISSNSCGGGGGGGGSAGGRKHVWSSAVPSALDDDDEDGNNGSSSSSDVSDRKRMKIACDSVV